MADARQDPTPSPPQGHSAADPASPSDGAVELSGHLDEGPVGFVRLFEDAAHAERYVDIKLKDVVRLFPEDAPDAAAGVTVIAIRGDAVVLIGEPVAAGALTVSSPEGQGDAASFEVKKIQPSVPGRKYPDGWPRRRGP